MEDEREGGRVVEFLLCFWNSNSNLVYFVEGGRERERGRVRFLLCFWNSNSNLVYFVGGGREGGRERERERERGREGGREGGRVRFLLCFWKSNLVYFVVETKMGAICLDLVRGIGLPIFLNGKPSILGELLLVCRAVIRWY